MKPEIQKLPGSICIPMEEVVVTTYKSQVRDIDLEAIYVNNRRVGYNLVLIDRDCQRIQIALDDQTVNQLMDRLPNKKLS